MRLIHLVIVFAAFVAPVRAGGVRIAQAPGLGSFQNFQAAVDAAAEGDVLLVAEGAYGSVTIASKGLWIVALPGTSPRIQGTLEIRDLGPGQHVLVSGLLVTGATQAVVSDAALVVANCQAHVRLQDCVLTGGYGAKEYYPGGEGGPGAVITGSPAVALVRCTLRGGAGYFSTWCYDCTGGRGGNGVESDQAAVALYDCGAIGGGGGWSGEEGGDGGHGYHLPSWGMFASGSHFLGGRGGDAQDIYTTIGGNGGHGLFVGGAQAQLLDDTFVGGAGGIAYGNPQTQGQPGNPIQNNGGVVNLLPGTRRVLLGKSLVSDAATQTLSLTGQPGDKLFLIGAKSPGFAYVKSSSGTWLVPSPFFSGYRPHGVVPPSGTLIVQLPTPDHTTPAERTYWQGLVVDAQGKPFLSSPLHQVTLDRAGPPDCNANGVTDWIEILEGTTPDCDENLVPDACDPDCNANGVPDPCDLAAGTSTDCDSSGVPDECENLPDCNNNSSPDVCDILNGTSKDLNGNGIPDECEASGTAWYVDAGAPAGGNGSQAQPFDTIAEGIAAALSGDTVLLLDGIYTGPGNRNLRFGGRDIAVVSQNGPGACIIDLEGYYTGFEVRDGESSAARIEGLTIRRAFSTWAAAAIYVVASDPVISNCVIADCKVNYFGAGIALFDSSSRVENCQFLRNSTSTSPSASSSRGAAIYVSASVGRTPVITGCLFDGNAAREGGALGVSGSCSLVVSHCVFTNNVAKLGGAILSFASVYGPVEPRLRVDDCLIAGNSAIQGGGIGIVEGPYHAGYTIPLTLTGTTLVGNVASSGGGALHAAKSCAMTMSNCVVWGNSSPAGAQIALVDFDSVLAVSYCDVQGGQAGVWIGSGTPLVWGMGNLDADPLFVGAPGGDYHLGAGSPCIDAADNGLVPPDLADVDGDGNLTEPVPLDLDLAARFADDPAVPDTGSGTPPIVDMGAYERPP